MLGLGQGMEEISSLGPKKRPKGSEASHQPSQQEGEGPYCHRPGEEGGEGWGAVGGGEGGDCQGQTLRIKQDWSWKHENQDAEIFLLLSLLFGVQLEFLFRVQPCLTLQSKLLCVFKHFHFFLGVS